MKRKEAPSPTRSPSQPSAVAPTAFPLSNKAMDAMEIEPEAADGEIDSRQWVDTLKLLHRGSPFGNETGKLPVGQFEPGTEVSEYLMRDTKVLVIGAGGLGCELLKDLALSGLRDLTVIDLDTIDLTNLNRQFLFRKKDVGRAKATVAAEFIMKRIPGCKVTAHKGRIQEFDADFYSQFNVVVSGLDNIEARRWLNSMMCSLVERDDEGKPDPASIIPLVDGGTEGFKGQARVILPTVTSCFECSLDMFPPQKVFPMCTIAETPRLPEHCITYAHILQWPKAFPDKAIDSDNPEHMKWVFEQASERAAEHHIEGVTYMLTIGVVKNVIPAVASTNAIIASVCANEVIKLITYYSQSLYTYLMYMGSEGIYGHTFEVEKKEDCIVCGSPDRTFTMPRSTTLQEFMDKFLCGPSNFGIAKPSITSASKSLFMQKPVALRKATEGNLTKAMSELCEHGEVLTVTDPSWEGTALAAHIHYED